MSLKSRIEVMTSEVEIMSYRLDFDGEAFEAYSEFDDTEGLFDEYSDEQSDGFSEGEDEAFDPELAYNLAGEVGRTRSGRRSFPRRPASSLRRRTARPIRRAVFRPTPGLVFNLTAVETPGGGRIADKTPPKPADLVTYVHSEFDEEMESYDSDSEADLFGELETPVSSFIKQFQEAVRLGKEAAAISLALLRGIRDENQLTNLVFQARHPDRGDRPLARNEKALVQEWMQIRDRLVRPSLGSASANRGAQVSSHQPATSSRDVSQQVLNNIAEYDNLIDTISAEYKLDSNIVRGIIAVESGGNPRSGEKNPTGYKGLLQAGTDRDQLDPKISIRSGIKNFINKRNSVARILTSFGISLSTLNQEEMLKYVMTAYNAGQKTLQKALEYAQTSGDIRNWERPEHFKRALLFTGAYSVRAPLQWCLTKLSPDISSVALSDLTGVEPSRFLRDYRTPKGWNVEKIRADFGKVIQAKLYGENVSLRKDTQGKATQNASPLLLCAVEFKHTHRPLYIDKFLRYKRHYDQNRVRR